MPSGRCMQLPLRQHETLPTPCREWRLLPCLSWSPLLQRIVHLLELHFGKVLQGEDARHDGSTHKQKALTSSRPPYDAGTSAWASGRCTPATPARSWSALARVASPAYTAGRRGARPRGFAGVRLQGPGGRTAGFAARCASRRVAAAWRLPGVSRLHSIESIPECTDRDSRPVPMRFLGIFRKISP
jgi:hypothetical protein